jgi:hypothetical protein
MTPLQHKKDFLLVPLLTAPITWGPRRSKSAGDQLTQYCANFFRLIFRRDPGDFLKKLGDDFTLVAESELEHRRDIGELVTKLSRQLPGGIVSVPPSWKLPISAHVATNLGTELGTAQASL